MSSVTHAAALLLWSSRLCLTRVLALPESTAVSALSTRPLENAGFAMPCEQLHMTAVVAAAQQLHHNPLKHRNNNPRGHSCKIRVLASLCQGQLNFWCDTF